MRRMIQECPGQIEAFAKSCRQRLYSESFRGVMTAIQKVYPKLLGQSESMVRSLSGKESVHSFRSDLGKVRSRSASYYPNALGAVRSGRTTPDLAPKNLLNSQNQFTQF